MSAFILIVFEMYGTLRVCGFSLVILRSVTAIPLLRFASRITRESLLFAGSTLPTELTSIGLSRDFSAWCRVVLSRMAKVDFQLFGMLLSLMKTAPALLLPFESFLG